MNGTSFYTKRDNLINEIIEYFENDLMLFNEVIEELDSWNGYLGDDRYYYMFELDDLFYNCKVSEFLEKIDVEHFNLCDDYFKYTIYGLRSYEDKDYTDYLDRYFVEELNNNIGHVYGCMPDELYDMICKLDTIDEESED